MREISDECAEYLLPYVEGMLRILITETEESRTLGSKRQRKDEANKLMRFKKELKGG